LEELAAMRFNKLVETDILPLFQNGGIIEGQLYDPDPSPGAHRGAAICCERGDGRHPEGRGAHSAASAALPEIGDLPATKDTEGGHFYGATAPGEAAVGRD
jgi:hypothetical protein